MVTFKRLMLWFGLGVALLGYMLTTGRLEEQQRWILLGIIALLAIFLMGTGGGRKVKRVRRKVAKPTEEEDEAEDDLPAPVTSEVDASSRRDAKLSRSRGKSAAKDEDEDEIEEVAVALADEEVTVDVIAENVHVAEEFIAEIDAESMEEADIEAFIDDRRDHHAIIRRRIEARRREQLADIRSDTAKIYQSADESEDLIALLATEDHGMTIIDEAGGLPEGSPIGAVFTRIDAERILKVRIPLDQGFIASQAPLPKLPPLPDLAGMPLPPLPDLGDLPLPPLPDLAGLPLPPLPEPSKLDTLRDEMAE
jgi:hypothetical protein